MEKVILKMREMVRAKTRTSMKTRELKEKRQS